VRALFPFLGGRGRSLAPSRLSAPRYYWHTVADYAEWKKVFDSDPLGREASGVLRYSIERPLDDEHTVIGELEFDSPDEAKTFVGRRSGSGRRAT